MKEWWLGLQSRERKTLIMGGVVLLISVVYFGMWEPFQTKLARLEQAVEKNRALLGWMERSAAQVEALRRVNRPAAGKRVSDGRSLLALVDQTAKRSRLGAALKRVEPEGKAAVRVWLEQAPFDDMMRWLSQLEQRNGIVIKSITIDRQDTPGRVNARIRLEGPGA